MDYLEKLEIAEKYEKAQSVQHYLFKMANRCGAALNPISLAHFAFEYLQEHQPNNNNTSLARNLAYLFSCLCNEFFLMSRKKQVAQSGDFYMSAATWQKYMLGGKIKKQVELLEKMDWIKCCIKTYSTKPYKREHYSINLFKLILLEPWAMSFESEKAAESRATADAIYEGFIEKVSES